MSSGMRKFLVVTVMAGVLVSGTPEAGAVTSGLAYVEDTVITVLEDTVRVDTAIIITNTTSDRRTGNRTYYSYFDSFQQLIPHGATDVSIRSRGRQLSTSFEELDEDFDILTARLPTELRSGQSRTVEVSFVLPVGSIRGDGLFFSNAAFHSFPIWSFSDPGTGSLVLRVPDNAVLGQFGGALRVTGSEDGYVQWEPLEFDVPEEVFSFVTVTVDEALVHEDFTVAGQGIVLRTWPGDDVWGTFARDTIEKGLPALESLIGLPVPDQDSLEITESVTPYFYGYGGWYNPTETTIEVGNELDDSVMLHELSHAWFNDALFDERWINEGLAEEFTWRAQRELGWSTEELPHEPGRSDPARIALLDWSNGFVASPGNEELRETEEYGYETSWYTVHQLAELIGVDGMRQVLAAADNDTISYVGDDAEETTSMDDDWRRLLDLVSEAAADGDEQVVEEIFVAYVIGDGWDDDLESRRAARQRYSTFAQLEPLWRVPTEVRVALTTWDFDTSVAVIDEATSVLDRYREVVSDAERNSLQLSDASRAAYEGREPDFDRAIMILDEQADAIPEVLTLRETLAGPLTTNERWGIGDVDLAPLVEHGEKAFALDAFDQIGAAQRDMEQVLRAADELGATRILWTKIGSGAAVLFVVLASWIVRCRRRNRLPKGLSDVAKSDVVLSA